MTDARVSHGRWNAGAVWRITCTGVSIVIVQTIVCGLAALPVVWVWIELATRMTPARGVRAGAALVLRKPFTIDELMEALG